MTEPRPTPLATGSWGGEAVLPGPALAVWREVTAGGGRRWLRPAAGLFVARRLLHKQQ